MELGSSSYVADLGANEISMGQSNQGNSRGRRRCTSFRKNVFSYKLQSLIIGGMIVALAGITRSMNTGFVETQQFKPQTTFFIWTVLILGGAASVWGPVVGAVTFWFIIVFVEELLRQMVESGWIPSVILESNDVASVRMIMMGIMLAVLMIWRPQGLVGKRGGSNRCPITAALCLKILKLSQGHQSQIRFES